MVVKYVSNTIPMRSSIVCWSFLTKFLSLCALFLACSICSYSQIHQASNGRLARSGTAYNYSSSSLGLRQDTTKKKAADSLPSPKSVMYKSMIIPGWGQITNRQIWKVPIVYGLLGGLTWYSISLTKSYHDYRAAYYNINDQTPDDQKYGPTPDYIPESANLRELKSIRNTYRNRRDLVYVGIALAYGLNIIDAYVFAHMRSFDVSEDLSLRTRIKPSVMAQATPGLTLSIDFVTK